MRVLLAYGCQMSSIAYHRSVQKFEFGEFFHFFVYICAKGGTCVDMSDKLRLPAVQPPRPEDYLQDTDTFDTVFASMSVEL
jgi:hypothetical protein